MKLSSAVSYSCLARICFPHLFKIAQASYKKVHPHQIQLTISHGKSLSKLTEAAIVAPHPSLCARVTWVTFVSLPVQSSYREQLVCIFLESATIDRQTPTSTYTLYLFDKKELANLTTTNGESKSWLRSTSAKP